MPAVGGKEILFNVGGSEGRLSGGSLGAGVTALHSARFGSVDLSRHRQTQTDDFFRGCSRCGHLLVLASVPGPIEVELRVR